MKTYKSKIVAYAQITRPLVKWLLPIISVISGAVMALGRLPVGSELGILLVAIFIFGPLVQGVSIRSVNDLFDYEVDKNNQKTDEFREFRPLVKGRLTKPEVATFAFLGHAAAVLGAFLLLNNTAGTILVLTLIGSWIYSAPPLRLRNHFLTQNALIGLFYCVGFHLVGWSLFKSWTAIPFQIYPGVFLAGFFGSVSKDFSDVKADSTKGIKTLPIILGPEKAARLFKFAFSSVFLLLAITAYLSGFPANSVLVSLAFIPIGYLLGHEMQRNWEKKGQLLMSLVIIGYLAWVLFFSLAYAGVF